ncbi:hypothetical protein [uncultured Aquimarina sp.]|uniref:hypothetical protein n=1 Tax=uncultured Aquimarina sp. TaxID=575652 RepID=UPI00260F1053|nr:hypothetical protein [uncultured Aquimarina sp.]
MFTLEILYIIIFLNLAYGILNLYGAVFYKKFSLRKFKFEYSISNYKYRYLKGFLSIFFGLAILTSLPRKLPKEYESFIGYWKGDNGNVLEIDENGMTLLFVKVKGGARKYPISSTIIIKDTIHIKTVLFPITTKLVINKFPRNGKMTLNNINYENTIY